MRNVPKKLSKPTGSVALVPEIYSDDSRRRPVQFLISTDLIVNTAKDGSQKPERLG
jgi:hypothetical protein